MTYNLSHILDSLGWALLHSVWQGLLGLAIVLMLRSLLKNSSPALRYWVQITVLASCFLAFLVTLASYVGQPSGAITLTEGRIQLLQITDLSALPTGDISAAAATLPQMISGLTPSFALIWCIGFAIMATRFLASYILTQRLKTIGVASPNIEWITRFEQLTARAGLPASVKLLVSERVNTPLTLGFFKPIVLVPVGFLASLPSDQIEAILLHEIAHIRRCDYAVNLIQTAIKTVFFYHPAIHLISRYIDVDREQACDDLAVAQGHNPKALAQGLAALRLANAPRLALSAMGPNRLIDKDTPLLARLKRLSGYSSRSRGSEPVIVSTLAVVLLATLYVGVSVKADAHPDRSENKTPLHANKIEQNYKFKTIRMKGKDVVVKVTEDGRRWILIDGRWSDIDRNPGLVSELPSIPQPPMPPKYDNSELAGGYDVESHRRDTEKNAKKFDQFQIDLEYFEKSLELYAKNNWANGDMVEHMIEKAERREEQALDQLEGFEDRLSDQIERQVEAELRKAEAQIRKEEAKVRAAVAREHHREAMERKAEQSSRHSHHDNDKARHANFRKTLTKRLIADNVITSPSETISVTYVDGAIMINGVNASRLGDGEYCELWEEYGMSKSAKSSIKISPKSYQIIDIDDGSRRSTRITYGEWNSKDEARAKIDTPQITLDANLSAQSFGQVQGLNNNVSTNVNFNISPKVSQQFTQPTSTEKTFTTPQPSQFLTPVSFSKIGLRNGKSVKGVSKSHNGIDMLATMGEPIYASAAGTVISAKRSGNWGYRIVLRHPNDFKTYYGHMGDMFVKSGDKIQAGQRIGTVGQTGSSNTPHLHFEIRQYGQVLDPEPFIFANANP